MERDPVRFVWRSAPGLHVAMLLIVLCLLPLTVAALDLTRIILDDAVGGRAYADGETAPFLRFVLDWPRVSAEPIVLSEGFRLTRPELGAAAPLGLLLAAGAIALLFILMAMLRSSVSARAITRLRKAVLEAILVARPTAREEAKTAAALAGESLARESGFLGGCLLTPVLSAGLILSVLAYALAIDWRLLVVNALAVALVAIAWPPRLEAQRRMVETRLTEGAAYRRALTDLVRRLPAVRAHGSGSYERDRLGPELAGRHRPVRAAERRLAAINALSMLALIAGLAAVLGVGSGLTAARATPGEIVAVMAGTVLAVRALDALAQWRRGLAMAVPLLDEIARTLGALQSRGRSRAEGSLPGSGALAARGVAAYDPASGARVSGVDLLLAFPAHVALTGDPTGGARVFAGLIGGQLEPSLGTLTFAGHDLAGIDPEERARRIAFAGGDTILLPLSLRENLLYGVPDPQAPDIEQRLADAVATAGLDGMVHARGLAGTVDPTREAALANALVLARRQVRVLLAEAGIEDFIDPFDRDRYNSHATVAENILFGVPLGDTFRDGNLPSHPYVRALLEAEDLTRILADMGLAIARNMVEIFADLPDDHPLFDRFAFFSASERGFYEDLVARQDQPRRGAGRALDRERLIGLALRYTESRHRLGLMSPDLEARLVRLRKSFAELLPTSLQPAIEFYDADRLCAAASVQDNLLFGRLAHDRAGAEPAVFRLVRHVIAERGLERDLFRVGLETRIDARGDGLTSGEIAAIDLARCLVRRPDILVVERGLDGLPTAAAEEAVARLRRALVGRGLVVVTPDLVGEMDEPPFDAIVRFDRGVVTESHDRRRAEAA